jgi:uncharacterized protein YbaP (TraB family)
LLETGQIDPGWNASIERYLAGENDNRDWPESVSEAYKDYVEREFVIVRNRHMAKRILDLADFRAMFVATGAWHLHGEEGIVNLLAREGYSVTVLEPPP